jgi:hypothetical protein
LDVLAATESATSADPLTPTAIAGVYGVPKSANRSVAQALTEGLRSPGPSRNFEGFHG